MSNQQQETQIASVEEWAGTLSLRGLQPSEAEAAVNAMMALASAHRTLAARCDEITGQLAKAQATLAAAERQLVDVDKNLWPWEPEPASVTGAIGRVQTILNLKADRVRLSAVEKERDAARAYVASLHGAGSYEQMLDTDARLAAAETALQETLLDVSLVLDLSSGTHGSIQAKRRLRAALAASPDAAAPGCEHDDHRVVGEPMVVCRKCYRLAQALPDAAAEEGT